MQCMWWISEEGTSGKARGSLPKLRMSFLHRLRQRLLVSPCGSVLNVQTSYGIVGSTKHLKKKKRARGKFEERKLRKKCSACQDHLFFKADAKRRLRKKGVVGLVVIWWVRGTCWPVLGTVTGAREVSMRSRVSRCAVLITGKRWIYRPENEVMHPQWRSLGEETRSSPRKSEVMEGVKPLAPSEAGASSEGVSGEGRTEGTGQGGSCPSSVSQGGSSAVGYSHSCTDCLQLQRVQLLARGPYWPL